MAALLTMVPPEKEDLSKKNYENRSIYSKIIDEQTLKKSTYIYKYIYIQTNCITFLPFEVGYK